VMSGAASVTMSRISTAMTKARLENGTCPRQISFVRRRRGWMRKGQIVLRETNHQVGVVVHPGALDRGARAELASGVRAENVEL